MANHDQPQPDAATSSESAIRDVLGQDLGCPDCGYNLRGLGSDHVTCPECGLTSDIAKLLTRQWNKPWYKAPGYSKLCLPVAWVMLAVLGWVVILAIIASSGSGSARSISGWWQVLVFGLIVVGGWVGLMAWVWQTMGGAGAVAFAMLAHVSFAAYLLGLAMLIGGLIMIIVEAFDPSQNDAMTTYLLGLLMIAGGVGMFAFARWLERIIAGYCIRLYLRRPTTS